MGFEFKFEFRNTQTLRKFQSTFFYTKNKNTTKIIYIIVTVYCFTLDSQGPRQREEGGHDPTTFWLNNENTSFILETSAKIASWPPHFEIDGAALNIYIYYIE